MFSQRLLAGLRTLRDEEEIRGDDTFQDPDDRVDPDERGPRLSVTLKQSPNGETDTWPAAQKEERSRRHPDTGDQSKAPQSAAGTPVPRDLLDPVILRTMPP